MSARALERGDLAGVGSPGPAPARRLPGAWTITAVLGLVYVILAPPSTDLAAAAYRSNLFERVGFTLWDNSWYGGHHLPAYSLLSPGLGALLGPQLLAAISMTAATALFAALIEGRFPRRATRLAAAWFALGAVVGLLSNRVPFDLGLAIALGSLLAAQRRHPWPSLPLAVLSSLASPVAGAFLALAFLTWALVGPARRWPAVLTIATLLPIALLALRVPGRGLPAVRRLRLLPRPARRDRPRRRDPPGAAGAAGRGTALRPRPDRLLSDPHSRRRQRGPPRGPARRPDRGQRAVRRGAPLAPPGARGARALPALLAGQRADRRLRHRRIQPCRRLLLLRPPAGGDTAARDRLLGPAGADRGRAQRRPLGGSLGRPQGDDCPRLGAPARPPPGRPLLRRRRAPHRPALPRLAGPRWHLLRGPPRRPPRLLREGGGAADRERAARLPAGSVALAPLAAVRRAGSDPPRAGAGEASERDHGLVHPCLRRRPAPTLVLVRFTPYWALVSGTGCVAQSSGGWTEVQARRPGSLQVAIRFSLARVFSRGARCT